MRIPSLVVLAGLALVAAGCGGNSSTASAPVTVTVTVTATPSDTPASTDPTAPATEDTSTAIPPAPGPLPDPCTLLTQKESEEVAGTPLDPPVDVGGGDDKTLCQRTGPVTGPTAQVSVFVGDGAKKQLDIDKDTLGHAFTMVPGIGDETYLEDGSVFVHVGSTWASIVLISLDSDQAAQNKRLTAAARIVASRLA